MSYRFLAIDFETASYKRDSACSVGLVQVESNRILSKQHYLIRPPDKKFVFTSIHGITWKQVEDHPSFFDLWPKISHLFNEIDFVVAHNASFDRSVLRACCLLYGIELPKVDFKCTVQLARKHLGIYPTNLPAVCRSLNISLKHHNAASDALACAKIAMATLKISCE